MWYHFILTLARFAFFLFGGLKSVGRHNVPKRGRAIIAPYHVSHLDPPAVACGTNRHLRFMAKEELFHSKFLGALIRSLGAFPVKRGEGDTEAIRIAIAALEKEEAVLIFPEGQRGDGKTIQPINRGVALLAKRTGALVVPVGVIGTHKAWPKGGKLRRSTITVAYGKPFTYADCATSTSEKENRDRFGRELQRRIVELCEANGLPLKIETHNEHSIESGALSKST